MNQLPKPKRGTAFYHSELKQTVWLDRIQSPTEFFVRLVENPTTIDDYKTVNVSDLKPFNKPGQSVKQVVKPVSPEEKKFRADLNVYFAKQTLTMPSNCENCGKPLVLSTMFARRCQTAHILEKSKFKTVACHPQNKLFLGVYNCSCHQKFDNSTAEERSKMPCHKIALQRFEEFKSDLSGPEQIRALTYLHIQWQ